MLSGFPNIDQLSETEARVELERLGTQLDEANIAYHRDDNPSISDAEFDALKIKIAAIEARFPKLISAESPSQKVGAAPAAGFSKVTHAIRMLSLSNGFDDDDIVEFGVSIRKYLGLPPDAPLAFTAEPKIDGYLCRCGMKMANWCRQQHGAMAR